LLDHESSPYYISSLSAESTLLFFYEPRGALARTEILLEEEQQVYLLYKNRKGEEGREEL
jgi:hypothetical protein